MTKNLLKIQKCFLRFQNISRRSQNIYHGLKLFFSKVSKIFFKISKHFSWSTIIFQSLKIFLDILAASSMRPLSQYLLWVFDFMFSLKLTGTKLSFHVQCFFFICAIALIKIKNFILFDNNPIHRQIFLP